jgi:hypothetical protein
MQNKQAVEPEPVRLLKLDGRVKWDFTAQDLRKIADFMNQLSLTDVKLEANGHAVLLLDGEETPFHLYLGDDWSYYVSVVVPL